MWFWAVLLALIAGAGTWIYVVRRGMTDAERAQSDPDTVAIDDDGGFNFFGLLAGSSDRDAYDSEGGSSDSSSGDSSGSDSSSSDGSSSDSGSSD